MEELLFKERLSETVRKARLHQNWITREEVEALFEHSLAPEQVVLVEEYLKGKGVKMEEGDASFSEPSELDETEVSFLQMYFDELAKLPKRTDSELLALKQAALSGDDLAKRELVNEYLPKVVEIARLYAGQGVSIEDLIGEGNIGLMMGFDLLSCIENVEEMEGHLGKIVMDAMEAAIARDNEDMEFDQKMLQKISEIAKKAEELSKIFGRDVTISELSEELRMPEDEIRQAAIMTGNQIEGIMVETDI